MADITKLQQELEEAAEATKQKIHKNNTNPNNSNLANTSAMQDVVIDIEKDLLIEIMKNLNTDKITPDDAQKLAQEFLALLPMQDKRDLLDKLGKLSKTNSEARGVFLKYSLPYEEEQRIKKLELMSAHIKLGKIEEALSVAKGDLNNG